MTSSDPPASSKASPAVGGPAVGSAPASEFSVGNYRFTRRLAPEPPSFLKDDTKIAMTVQRDVASNSWVWVGGSLLGAQILDLAKAYDLEQPELDLEFVLVLVSTDDLKARGVSVFYDGRASWLNALQLTGDSSSLRLSSGGWGVDLTLAGTTSGLHLLSQPVVRCLEGVKWSFTNDTEVPVPRSDVVDGAVRNSIEFRPVGFGLDGVVRIFGERIVLEVEQRNGSLLPAATADTAVPTFSTQKLQTSCDLAWWEWTVLGGIQVDREQLRRGLFRSSVQTTSDYLVIFVRPRLALEAPPRAVPVDSPRGHHPLVDLPGMSLDDGALLPPPPEWEDEERELVRRKLGHPAK